MNQGIAFARTLRSLEADDFRTSKVGLFVGVLVIGVWTWWMLGTRVPQYETTTQVRVESGHIAAFFPVNVLARIQAGQSAIVHSNGGAVTTRVEATAYDHAEVAWPGDHQPHEVSSIEIEIARVSPASIAFRSIGHR